MKDKKYIGKWDCEFCGTIGIDAIIMGSDGKPIRVLSCPNCGANIPTTKNGKSPFYLPKNKSDWEVLDQKYSHAFGVPNWVCSSCEAENPDISEIKRCLKCGNPKENSDSKRIKIKSGTNPKKVLRDADEFKSEEDLIDNLASEQYNEVIIDTLHKSKNKKESRKKIFWDEFIKNETSHKNKYSNSGSTYIKKRKPIRNIFTRRFKTILFSTLGVLTLGFLIWFLFIDDVEKFGHIDDKTWNRTLLIEDYKKRDKSGWEDELPSDADVYSRSEEIHHYDKVYSHTETKTKTVEKSREVEDGVTDNGDGTFTQNYKTEYYDVEEEYSEDIYDDVPVYETWCNYNVWRWEYKNSLKTDGSVKKNDNPVPYWHNFTEKKDERVSNKKQKYIILILTNDNKSYTDSYKQSQWEKYKLNQDVKIIVNRVGYVKEIYIVE